MGFAAQQVLNGTSMSDFGKKCIAQVSLLGNLTKKIEMGFPGDMSSVQNLCWLMVMGDYTTRHILGTSS